MGQLFFFFPYICISRSVSLALKCGFGIKRFYSQNVQKNIWRLALLSFPDTLPLVLPQHPFRKVFVPTLISLPWMSVLLLLPPPFLCPFLHVAFILWYIVLNTLLSTQHSKSRTSADSLQPSALPCASFQHGQYDCALFTLGYSPRRGVFVSWTTEVWIVQILSHMNSFNVLRRNRPYVRNNYEH